MLNYKYVEYVCLVEYVVFILVFFVVVKCV